MGSVIELVNARKVRNLGRSALARAMVQWSRDHGGPVLGTDPSSVLRWEEKGRRPDELAQGAMAALFGIDPALIGSHPWPQWLAFDPLQHYTDHPWTSLGARQAVIGTVGSDMHRRTFVLSSSAVATALLTWLTAEPAQAEALTGRRIGESGVALIERQVRALRQDDDADGGGSLITTANATLSMTADLLSHRSYSLAHGRRLYAAAADLTRMRAWAAFDVYGRCDDQTFKAALQAAHAAGDTQLGAHILNFWAAAAYNCDRPADAEQIASCAVAAVRGKAAARVEAIVYARAARARSQLGRDDCWAALERAEQSLDQAEGQGADESEPEWAYWFDPTEASGTRASTELAMGRYRDAELTFARASNAYTGQAVRTHALYLVRQANAQLRQAHLEQACATAHQALDLTTQISSHRTIGPLADLADAMDAYRDVQDVRDLRERMAAGV